MAITESHKRELLVESGSRCLLCACALIEDDVYIGEFAHVVSPKKNGPRGTHTSRKNLDVHHKENIVVLCPGCHVKIDKNPDRYPVESVLKRKHKRRHQVLKGRFRPDILQQRPVEILVSLALLLVSLLAGGVKAWLDFSHFNAQVSQEIIWTMIAVVSGVMVFLGSQIWFRKRWARNVYTALVIIGVVPAITLIPEEMIRNSWLVSFSGIQILAQVLAVIMLFLPASSRWFNLSRSVRKQN